MKSKYVSVLLKWYNGDTRAVAFANYIAVNQLRASMEKQPEGQPCKDPTVSHQMFWCSDLTKQPIMELHCLQSFAAEYMTHAKAFGAYSTLVGSGPGRQPDFK